MKSRACLEQYNWFADAVGVLFAVAAGIQVAPSHHGDELVSTCEHCGGCRRVGLWIFACDGSWETQPPSSQPRCGLCIWL